MPGPFDKGWGTVVCAASGPSFSEDQALQVERARAAGLCYVLAVGRTGSTRLPNVDAIYSSDAIFWRNYIDEIRENCQRAELWTQDVPSAKKYGLRHIPLARRHGLSRDLGKINAGGNSGYQGIGLAYLFGARRLILCGFDMQRGPNGESHHFGDHIGRGVDAARMHNSPAAAYKDWCPRFDALAKDLEAAGVDVVNCTSRSALTCFKRADLATTLQALT